MHSPHTEERTVTSLTALALDIAEQLETQSGKAVVVCEHPSIAASLTKKQWAQLLRTVERAHAATLDTHKRQELSQKIASMRSLVFSAAGKADQLETSQPDDVYNPHHRPQNIAPYNRLDAATGHHHLLSHHTQAKAPGDTEFGGL